MYKCGTVRAGPPSSRKKLFTGFSEKVQVLDLVGGGLGANECTFFNLGTTLLTGEYFFEEPWLTGCKSHYLPPKKITS